MKRYFFLFTLVSLSSYASVEVQSLETPGNSATLFQRDGLIYKRTCPGTNKSCANPEEMKIGSEDELAKILYSQAEKILNPSSNYLTDEVFSKKILVPLSEQERKKLQKMESFLVESVDSYKKKTNLDQFSKRNLDQLSKKLSTVQGRLSSEPDFKKNQEEVKQVISRIIGKISNPTSQSLNKPDTDNFEYVITSEMVDFISGHTFKALYGRSNCTLVKEKSIIELPIGSELYTIMSGTKYLASCVEDEGRECEKELSKLYEDNICKDLDSPDVVSVKDEAHIVNGERSSGKELSVPSSSGTGNRPTSKQ